ncbi:MAG TPA: helix-turn-helix domain-containing protein [Ohtaekwangia sp.]|nr:helix-turn-helix domain-containing protein [Ohtaekwangia sp.]
MKNLTILVPNGEGNNLSSIVGAYKIFSRANEYRKKCGKTEVFKIQLAGTSKKIHFYDGLFSVQPHVSITAIRKTNLIIIPSLNHNYETSVKQNRSIVHWIKEQHELGAEIASICTGAFLLAESGLLNGKACSTHWSAADDFRNRFPEIDVRLDKLITDEKGIYTNGGAYSFLNLIIYLVEKFYDRPTAIYCSKVFQIEMDRQSQLSFTIFKGQKQHHDDVVKKAQEYIEKNAHQKISIDRLSSKLAVGRRNFDRRFIKATGDTPLEYAQRVRIEAAKRAFENTPKTVNEVMYEVGYSDAKAFREVFRRITGRSPLEYRSTYQKQALMN